MKSRAAVVIFRREEKHIVVEKQNRLNEEIIVDNVRLIGKDGEQIGIVATNEALNLADEAGLDLVEIVPNSEPPVCRIMDFGKFQFDQNKKKHAAKKKQKQIQIKEVKFRPGTEEGDYQVKLRNVVRFLSNGDKVKVTLRFRGREMAHQDLGLKMLQRIAGDIEEYGIVEQMPKLEGRQMVMVIASKR
jgi:translation initiation factor IF-3